jgi:hypothetical protein
MMAHHKKNGQPWSKIVREAGTKPRHHGPRKELEGGKDEKKRDEKIEKVRRFSEP